MSNNKGARIKLKGRVQRVGFRWFTVKWAEDLNLGGWVKNNWDGSVEVEVEGNEEKIESLVKVLKEGPKDAIVDDINVEWKSFMNQYRKFEIKY